MKSLQFLFVALVSAIFVGCATEKQVAQMEGRGKKEAFNAPYDAVWRAAVDAAQAGELNVVTADKERGYIGASRGIQMNTMGENVGVWVTEFLRTKQRLKLSAVRQVCRFYGSRIGKTKSLMALQQI